MEATDYLVLVFNPNIKILKIKFTTLNFQLALPLPYLSIQTGLDSYRLIAHFLRTFILCRYVCVYNYFHKRRDAQGILHSARLSIGHGGYTVRGLLDLHSIISDDLNGRKNC
jgi:hypothetical protein